VLLGYRRTDVDAAIARRDAALASARETLDARQARVDELEQVAGRLAEKVVAREGELREVRAELADERRRSEEALRALGRLSGEIGDLRERARAQATRIRLQALREASELSVLVNEAGRGDERPRRRLLEELKAAVERVGSAEEPDADSPLPVPANGSRSGAKPGEVFDGLVEVEVGPLSDFSQLVGFEDAASGIAATSEVSIKRFSGGRATLEMHLKHPVELLRELEERSPFEFKVRDQRRGRVVLDVEEARKAA
jgi:hypothetical protein